jgi:hypothetical protein
MMEVLTVPDGTDEVIHTHSYEIRKELMKVS